jgi:UDP-GlcNAc:undecaprenyl-phosphate GlcNAc-1-phosphate transferase
MLPVTPRLLIQFLAAVLLVVPGAVYPSNFGGLFADPLPSFLLPLAIVFALLFVVGMINATNMSDGADGLAGGLVAASLFWLALVARHLDRPNLAFLALLLLAAVVGFLAFNMRHPWRSKASVFMGDAGSVALGAALGFLVLNLCSGPKSVSFFLLAWIIIVPAMDMVSLIVRRLLAGRSPMSADRWHLHHLLMDLGVPHAAAVGLILMVSVSCGALAWIAIVLKVPESILVAGLVLPVAAHTLFVLVAAREIALRAGRNQAAVPIKIAASGLEGSGS